MPSTNGRHSTIGALFAPVCCGNEIVSAEDKTLSPEEPVSTRIPLMVWQLVVLPGAQSVTLVNAPSMYGEFNGGAAVGPVFTEMACTFDTDPVVPPPVPLPPLVLLLGLEPPHPAAAANAPAKLKHSNPF